MAIHAECPACHAAFNAPEKYAGKRVKCPKCGTSIGVAESPAAADATITSTSASTTKESKIGPLLVFAILVPLLLLGATAYLWNSVAHMKKEIAHLRSLVPNHTSFVDKDTYDRDIGELRASPTGGGAYKQDLQQLQESLTPLRGLVVDMQLAMKKMDDFQANILGWVAKIHDLSFDHAVYTTLNEKRGELFSEVLKYGILSVVYKNDNQIEESYLRAARDLAAFNKDSSLDERYETVIKHARHLKEHLDQLAPKMADTLPGVGASKTAETTQPTN